MTKTAADVNGVRLYNDWYVDYGVMAKTSTITFPCSSCTSSVNLKWSPMQYLTEINGNLTINCHPSFRGTIAISLHGIIGAGGRRLRGWHLSPPRFRATVIFGAKRASTGTANFQVSQDFGSL